MQVATNRPVNEFLFLSPHATDWLLPLHHLPLYSSLSPFVIKSSYMCVCEVVPTALHHVPALCMFCSTETCTHNAPRTNPLCASEKLDAVCKTLLSRCSSSLEWFPLREAARTVAKAARERNANLPFEPPPTAPFHLRPEITTVHRGSVWTGAISLVS